MDMAAEGRMLPMVGNVEEVRHIINSMECVRLATRRPLKNSQPDCFSSVPSVDRDILEGVTKP
jgi:hypothetical protein